MGNVTIAFMLAVGVSAWVYAKAFHATRTHKTAALASGTVFIILFIIALVTLAHFSPKTPTR